MLTLLSANAFSTALRECSDVFEQFELFVKYFFDRRKHFLIGAKLLAISDEVVLKAGYAFIHYVDQVVLHA
jgi:hypothetical protein